ncbi:hypothetical protein ACJIZ3_022867 [Penstemon smallii]|uniref:Uncharacterized protein n=1 Tax=Penstemon smallii TaxID=265156 RepID=A0ABD3TNS5_9LAMI
MASLSAALSQSSFSGISTFNAKIPIRLFFPIIRAVKSSEPQPKNEKTTVEEASPNAQTTAKAAPKPKKPVYSMKKGQIVRVDKEKYLNSINYLSVGHPPYYKGLDYIYEDRGEQRSKTQIHEDGRLSPKRIHKEQRYWLYEALLIQTASSHQTKKPHDFHPHQYKSSKLNQNTT